MKKVKTVLDWLNEAKEQGYEWADAAIYNVNNGRTCAGEKCNPSKVCSSLRNALDAFDWGESSQTFSFWEKVYTES